MYFICMALILCTIEMKMTISTVWFLVNIFVHIFVEYQCIVNALFIISKINIKISTDIIS